MTFLADILATFFEGINLWAALAVTFVAGLMRGFAGFGSAMLMAPIFAMLFGSADMVVTVVAIELVVSFQLFPEAPRHANWQRLTPCLLYTYVRADQSTTSKPRVCCD